MAESPKNRRLGAHFASLKFSDGERARIAAAAASGGLVEHILTTYGPKTKHYKETFQKKEKIPGFRPGTEIYDKKAVPRIIRYMSDSKNGNYKFFWELYREAAIDYVVAELSYLDELLRETYFSGTSIESSDAIKLICTNAAEFGVTSDDVRKLYEVWWIERTTEFETHLTLCTVKDENKEKKRDLKKVELELQRLTELVNNLSTKITNHEKGTAEVLETSQARISEMDEFVKQLSTTPAEVVTKSITALEVRFKALEEHLSRLSERQKAIELTSKDFYLSKDAKDLKKIMDESRALIRKSLDSIPTHVSEVIEKDIKPTLQELENRISTLSKELSKKKEHKEGPETFHLDSSKYKSPLDSIPIREVTSFKVTNELDFVNSWMAHLSKNEAISITFEQALSYHLTFLASDAVVVSEFQLAKTWIDCLGWNASAMHLVAAPTWSSEEDWRQGIDHLFKASSETAPKILVIHNYDVAVVECFLVPTLILWSLQQGPKGFAKIFLVPSQGSSPINHQILEFAPSFGEYDYLTQRSLQLKSGIQIPTLIRQEIRMGVDPRTVAEWLKPHGKINYDFQTIRKSHNISLSPRIVSRFQKVASFHSKYFEDPCAVGAAMHQQLLPWVKARHGDSLFSELGAYLKQLPDIRY